MNSPLVSAIIPTYNRAYLVKDAVDSILAQTYENIEVIVVDDGSTDNTLEVLSAYCNRIRVIRQENAGPAAARNRGIAASSGELIAFLDSDDLWLPEKLERQVKLLQSAGPTVSCCLCNIRMCWPDKESNSFDIAALSPEIPEGIWLNVEEIIATRFLLFNQGAMIRRTVLEKIGGFDESLWLLEDHALALRLSLEGPWTFVRDPLVIWRESVEDSLSKRAQRDDFGLHQPLVTILEKHLQQVNEKRPHKRLQRYVSRELQSAQRQLKAASIRRAPIAGSSIAADLLRVMERYRRALFVRSPWFPKMVVRPSNCQANCLVP